MNMQWLFDIIEANKQIIVDEAHKENDTGLSNPDEKELKEIAKVVKAKLDVLILLETQVKQFIKDANNVSKTNPRHT